MDRISPRTLIILIIFFACSTGWLSASWGQQPPETTKAEASASQEKPTAEPGKLTLQFKNMDIIDVLRTLSEKSGLNIVAGKEVTGRITIFLSEVDVLDALDVICEVNDLAYVQDANTIKVFTEQKYEQLYGKKFRDRTIIRVFSLKHTQADLVTKELLQIKTKDGKIITDARANGLIIIDVPQAIRRMRTIIENMDVPVTSETFSLTYTTPDIVQTAIQPILTPLGKIQIDTKNNKMIITDTKENIDRAAQIIKEYDSVPSTITKVFTLRYAKQKDVAPIVTAELTPAVGNAHLDEKNNALIVTDLSENINRIETMIEALDKKPQEVLIEAKVLQVSLDDRTRLGVNWEAVGRRIKELGEVNVKATFDILGAGDPGGRIVSGVLDEKGYTATLEVLQTVAKTNLLSSPRITALNNEEAKILVGASVPYKTVDTREENGAIRTFERVTIVDVGVKLFVTPTINEEGFVTLKIRPEVSTVTGYSEGIPIVEKSETETSVMVKDGVTIVIGGLIKDEHRKIVHRIPILGWIPILGIPFRSTDDTIVKTELVIFLTPHIITGDTDTEELIKLKRFNE